ncbi:MAG: hypothetical protein M1827_002318 [Pycnora praestabilis]|nr:MAG: hypothetical protein M1827_002318 [Pycnora praestabilis]
MSLNRLSAGTRKVFATCSREAPRCCIQPIIAARLSSTETKEPESSRAQSPDHSSSQASKDENFSTTKKKKTMAELDEELRTKMEGIGGDGGEAGMELEDGKPVSMKRGVKNNMFRYI